MSELLLVYGTLKRIARQRGGRPAHVWGRMWENGAYPAIRLTEPGDAYRIAGLTFDVTDHDLAAFDRVEGVAHSWYRRVRTTTVEGEGVWVYEGERCLPHSSKPQAFWRELSPQHDDTVTWDGT